MRVHRNFIEDTQVAYLKMYWINQAQTEVVKLEWCFVCIVFPLMHLSTRVKVDSFAQVLQLIFLASEVWLSNMLCLGDFFWKSPNLFNLAIYDELFLHYSKRQRLFDTYLWIEWTIFSGNNYIWHWRMACFLRYVTLIASEKCSKECCMLIFPIQLNIQLPDYNTNYSYVSKMHTTQNM